MLIYPSTDPVSVLCGVKLNVKHQSYVSSRLRGVDSP